MSNSMPKKKTARQEYIRLLERAANESEVALLAELIESKHIKGVVRNSPEGVASGAAVTGLTLEGRLLLQKLKKDEADDSALGRGKKYGLILLGVLGGLLIDLAKDVALKVLE